jgi:hypothetical protein
LQVREQVEKRTSKPPVDLCFIYDPKTEYEKYARELRNAALGQGSRSRFRPKPTLNEFRQSYGCVFIYGNTERDYIERCTGDYLDLKKKAETVKLSVKPFALFQAPPEDENKKQVAPAIGMYRPEEWDMYGSRDEFRPNDIEKYCKVLRGVVQ